MSGAGGGVSLGGSVHGRGAKHGGVCQHVELCSFLTQHLVYVAGLSYLTCKVPGTRCQLVCPVSKVPQVYA